jgi:hypothetical protein
MRHEYSKIREAFVDASMRKPLLTVDAGGRVKWGIIGWLGDLYETE